LTLVLIWGVLLPGFLRGFPPILLTAVIAIISTVVTLVIVGGRSLKSIAAITGTLGGVAVAGLLAFKLGNAAYLTGFGSEEAGMLLYIPQAANLDIRGLLFSGIIIGALGASMDMSMSVASAVEEVIRVCPGLGFWRLFQSGMNVGRDVIGTMANTLILAYTGSSLQLILVFMAYQESLLKILNLDMIASEVVRALSGSIGMIMVIPLTSITAAILYSRTKKKDEAQDELEVGEAVNTLN
ncbi:MAG: YibE/F family protein, partial [Bacteroidota bacterium]